MQFAGELSAVQVNDVPVVVVLEAVKPPGAAGAAEQVVPPPLLLLLPPPQEGRNISPLSREPIRIRPNKYLRRVPAPSRPPPASTIATGSHTDCRDECKRRAGVPARGAVVLTVSVEVPEPPLTEAELNAQVGAGVPPPLTLHVRVTAFPLASNGLTEIVEVAALPAFTADNGVAVMNAYTVAKASGQGTAAPPPANMQVAVLPAL